MIRICLSNVPHMYESCHRYVWVTSNVCMNHVTYVNASYFASEGWGLWDRSRVQHSCPTVTNLMRFVLVCYTRMIKTLPRPFFCRYSTTFMFNTVDIFRFWRYWNFVHFGALFVTPPNSSPSPIPPPRPFPSLFFHPTRNAFPTLASTSSQTALHHVNSKVN